MDAQYSFQDLSCRVGPWDGIGGRGNSTLVLFLFVFLLCQVQGFERRGKEKGGRDVCWEKERERTAELS